MNMILEFIFGTVIILAGAFIGLEVQPSSFILGGLVIATSMLTGAIIIVKGLPKHESEDKG